jgi:hypothetical protein
MSDVSLSDQIAEVEDLIRYFRTYAPGTPRRMSTLKSIAADLRTRLPEVSSTAVVEIERRMAALERNGRHGDVGAKVGIAEEVIGRWPVIRQALEFYHHHVSRPAEVSRG